MAKKRKRQTKYHCKKCGRGFGSSWEVSQHYRKLPSHASKFSKHNPNAYPSSLKKYPLGRKEIVPMRRRLGAAMPLKKADTREDSASRRVRQRAAYRRKKATVANEASEWNFCPNCRFPLRGAMEGTEWQA